MLFPEIIHRAIRGTLPEDISLAKLYKLSSRWEEQLKQLEISNIKSKQVILKLQKQLARQGRMWYITEHGNAFRG